MINKTIIEVSQEDIDNNKRLDAFLSKKLTNYSRSIIKKMFEDGLFVSDKKIELKKMPKAPCSILFTEPEIKETQLEAQDIPLEILFEDDHLVIINKHQGLVVHPAPGNPDKTLVNAILWHCPNLTGVGNEKRPGIVHRLDKGTSGVMVVAKTQKAHEGLVKLFSTHDIDRYYEAIVLGTRIKSEQQINAPIGRSHHNRLKMAANVTPSKNAITHVKALEFFNSFSHLEMKLETGRTHQIRVHLSQILKAPIINDELYGRAKEESHKYSSKLKKIIKDHPYPFLHAKVLGFVHPITKEKIYIETTPPQIFKDVLEALRNESIR